MRKIILQTSILATTSFILVGCGGGGGGGSAPTPPPPVLFHCEAYGEVDNAFRTEEYCTNDKLSAVRASSAHVAGYTGAGVTVAVLDSGVDKGDSDLKNQITPQSVSFVGKDYNTTSGSVEDTLSAVTQDQIEKIIVGSGGTGYSTAPTITVNGDGTGAEAIALLDANGSVSGIYMTKRGSGYTTVSLDINNSGTGGSGLTISDFTMGGDDDFGHGTSVSGIIGAEKNQASKSDPYLSSYFTHGVAYDAKIMTVKVLDSNGVGYAGQIESGVTYASTHGARVLNMSLGTTSDPFDADVFRDALNANSTIVVAAGNDGLNCLPVNGSLDGQCSFPAAIPWESGNSDMTGLDGGWIVVGAVDANNVITSYSNKAGVTKDNYLVAPGNDVTTTGMDNTLVGFTGTSAATPIVAGAMALMIQKYPHLKGKDLAKIFFDTATDLGDAGVDDVYGNGLINIEKAFAPVGSLGIVAQGQSKVITNSGKTPINKTKLVLSSAFGKSITKAQSLNNTVAFDSFGRDYQINLTSAVSYDTNQRFSFDRFSIMNYDGVLLGLDQANQKFMIGYNLYKNKNIMFSYDNTMLGSRGEGSLGFNKAKTYYMSFNDTKEVLGSDFRFKYQFDYGYAKATPTKESIISSISGVQAVGGMAKIYYKNFGVSYGIPLSVVKGNMSFAIPVSRNLDGTVNYANSQTNLKNNYYEEDFSLFHELKSGTIASYIAFNIIKNINGTASNKLERSVTINFNKFF